MPKGAGPSSSMLFLLAAVGLLSSAYSRRSPATAAVSEHAPAGGPEHRLAARHAERSWWTVIKRTFAGFTEDRLMSEAAGVTFYSLLAIFPALATMVSLFGLFADPGRVNDQLQSLAGVIPGGGLDLITQQVKSLTSNGTQALGIGAVVGLLTSLWSSNQGIKALFDALNVVYHEKERRSYIRLTLTSLCFTFGGLVFILLAMTAVIIVPIVLNFLGVGDWSTALIAAARWPGLMVLLGLFLAFVYRFGPCRPKARWRWISWGSAFSSITWLLASLGFSYYVANFGSYNKTYGSLGAVVGFMTWIWISAIIILLGGELNAELEQSTNSSSTARTAR